MADVSDKMEAVLRPALERLLEPGEQLVGMCVAVQQSAFRGGQVALGITERRVLLQPLDRRSEPKGDPVTIGTGELADAGAQGAGGGWVSAQAGIMDNAAITVKLRKVDGTKLKLQLMRGGDGFLGPDGRRRAPGGGHRRPRRLDRATSRRRLSARRPSLEAVGSGFRTPGPRVWTFCSEACLQRFLQGAPAAREV